MPLGGLLGERIAKSMQFYGSQGTLPKAVASAPPKKPRTNNPIVPESWDTVSRASGKHGLLKAKANLDQSLIPSKYKLDGADTSKAPL